MTCKEVSTLVSTGWLADAPLARRLAVRLHLAMCRHCWNFRRQVEAIAEVARSTTAAIQAEPPADFEATIVQRLER